LVELVARQCGIEDDLGVKGKRGVLKSMKSRQEFRHFSLISTRIGGPVGFRFAVGSHVSGQRSLAQALASQ